MVAEAVEAVLHVEKREKKTKAYLKQLRREGKIPGVYYTHGEEAVPVIINAKELHQLVAQNVSIFQLSFGKGEKWRSILKEIQYDPISGSVLHVDLMGVHKGEKVVITVPVNIIGTPIGVKEMGGVLEHPTRELEVRCLPENIPTSIDVDVSDLKVHDAIRIKDLDLPGIEFTEDQETMIAQVLPPRVEEVAEEEVAEEEEAEPEVVTGKKEESEEKKEE